MNGASDEIHIGEVLARAIQRYRHFAAHGIIPQDIAEDRDDLRGLSL
jgi:hypothetical protein